MLRKIACSLMLTCLAAACSRADFATTAPKQSINANLGPEVDCTTMDAGTCHSTKAAQNATSSFRTVNCTAQAATTCADMVNQAIARDGDNNSEIRVVNCQNDAQQTCTKISQEKNGKGPVILTTDTNAPNPGKLGDGSSVKGSLGKVAGGGDGFIPSAAISSGGADTLTPPFGLLINQLPCAMCHLQVNGNVASTTPVNSWNVDAIYRELFDPDNHPLVLGSWFTASSWTDTVADTYHPGQSIKQPITVNGGVQQNYSGPNLPNSLDGSGKPSFPQMDVDALAAAVTGGLSGAGADGTSVTISRVYTGNVTLVGTQANPIKINSDVLIKGDLVIKGYYTGVGSIYVSGRVYIPANLQAVNSVFPYPTDPSAALAQAQQLVDAKKGDALGIATPNSIFLGDLTSSLWTDSRNPDETKNAGVDEVYSWYPGGQTAYAKLYEAGDKCDNGGPGAVGDINLVEAFLYAQNTIGGVSRSGSWSINGGVITDTLHFIGAGGANLVAYAQKSTKTITFQVNCTQPLISKIHHQPMNRNYINYDYRLQVGLRLLSHFGKYFARH